MNNDMNFYAIQSALMQQLKSAQLFKDLYAVLQTKLAKHNAMLVVLDGWTGVENVYFFYESINTPNDIKKTEFPTEIQSILYALDYLIEAEKKAAHES